MKSLVHIVAAVVLWAWLAPVRGQPQIWPLDPAAVLVSQVDFTYDFAPQPDSTTGLFSYDTSAVLAATGNAISAGFINVFSHDVATSGTSDPWVVRNMPVDSFFDVPGLSTHFDLGSTAQGIDVTVANLAVTVSNVPLLSGPASAPAFNFAVGDVENNAEGAGGPGTGGAEDNPRTDPPRRPDTSIINFNPLLPIRTIWQTGHPNIEQAKNQCMPASVANSLQWLENTHGIDVPDNHVPGERDNSLVGKLDVAMTRPAGRYTPSARAMVQGKLNYLDGAGLGDDLIVKHKERAGINWLADTLTSTGGKATSKEDKTRRTLIQWILDELEHGEDVEIRIGWDGGGGHAVELIGGGEIFGVPWLAWTHDTKQGKAGGLSVQEGGIGWSTIGPNGEINVYANGKTSSGTVDFAVSESIPAPAGLVLLALGVAAMGRRDRGG